MLDKPDAVKVYDILFHSVVTNISLLTCELSPINLQNWFKPLLLLTQKETVWPTALNVNLSPKASLGSIAVRNPYRSAYGSLTSAKPT